jgi:hypothetical protein
MTPEEHARIAIDRRLTPGSWNSERYQAGFTQNSRSFAMGEFELIARAARGMESI